MGVQLALAICEEFKEFALRGNVIDLAIGVVIGSAFSAITASLVKDIIMPLLGLLTSGIDVASLAVPLGTGEEPAMLAYGQFLSAIINFLIIAMVLFVFVRSVNKLRNRQKKAEAPAKEQRICPYCCQPIDDKATRCPHCTSVLTEK